MEKSEFSVNQKESYGKMSCNSTLCILSATWLYFKWWL